MLPVTAMIEIQRAVYDFELMEQLNSYLVVSLVLTGVPSKMTGSGKFFSCINVLNADLGANNKASEEGRQPVEDRMDKSGESQSRGNGRTGARIDPFFEQNVTGNTFIGSLGNLDYQMQTFSDLEEALRQEALRKPQKKMTTSDNL